MKLKYLAILVVSLVAASCTNNDEISELTTQSEIMNTDGVEFANDVHQFSNSNAALLVEMAKESNNYNTTSTRAMQADDKQLNAYVEALASHTRAFLIENGIEAGEMEGLDNGRMAYVGLMLVDYDKTIHATRASIGDCVLRGAGLGDLAVKHVISKRVVIKTLIKAGLKRAVPYIGWGLFAGETAACLMGY